MEISKTVVVVHVNFAGQNGNKATNNFENVFVKFDNENEEVNLGKSAFSLYAKYVGMDGYLGL